MPQLSRARDFGHVSQAGNGSTPQNSVHAIKAGVSCSSYALSLSKQKGVCKPRAVFHPGVASWLRVGGFWFPCPSQAGIHEVFEPSCRVAGELGLQRVVANRWD